MSFSRKKSPSLILKIPGINICPRIDLKPINLISKNLADSCNLRNNIQSEEYIDFIPASISKSLPFLERKKIVEDNLYAKKNIKLVDGSDFNINSNHDSPVTKVPLKKIERQDCIKSIKRCRIKSKFFSEIISIMHNKIYNQVLKTPVWRINRVEMSVDNRYVVIRWVIDDLEDYKKYKEMISKSLELVIKTVRFELGKRFSFGFTPEIRFVYEDYLSTFIEELEIINDSENKSKTF